MTSRIAGAGGRGGGPGSGAGCAQTAAQTSNASLTRGDINQSGCDHIFDGEAKRLENRNLRLRPAPWVRAGQDGSEFRLDMVGRYEPGSDRLQDVAGFA